MGNQSTDCHSDTPSLPCPAIQLPPAHVHVPLTGNAPPSIPSPPSSVPPTPSIVDVLDRQLETMPTSSDTGLLLNESSLPPVDRGKAAWTYLISATILETVIWSWPASFGVFLEAYLDDPTYNTQKSSTTLLPLIGTLSMGIMFLSGPVIYPLCSVYPRYRRYYLWGGTILCVLSLFSASFTTNITALIVLEGILYALGGSLRYATCLSYFSEWFVQRQGLANGVISAGSVGGGIFLPLIFPPLISIAGPEKTLRYISLFMAAVLLPTLPFIQGRLPEVRAHVRRPVPRGAMGGRRFFEMREWMKRAKFWVVMIMNFSQGLGYFVPVLYLPTFATAIPLSKTNAAIALSLLNGSSVIGRLLFGHLCDLFNCWVLALSTLILTALSTFILWGVFSTTFVGLLLFAIVFGGVTGGWPSLWTGFIKGVAEDDPMALTPFFAYLMFSRGLGNLLSTPISSAFYSNPHILSSSPMSSTGGYAVGEGKFGMMILFVGICFLVCAAITVVGWVWKGGSPRGEARGGYHVRWLLLGEGRLGGRENKNEHKHGES